MRALSLWIALFFTSLTANADWTLSNDDSALTFLTTKNTHITEVGHFKMLAGKFDGQSASLEIDLTSVDTLIPIRNERMAKYLFETTDFAKANITVAIDKNALSKLNAEGSLNTTLQAKVSLHGKSKSLSAQVFIDQDNEGNIRVISTQPVLIQASDFTLSAGIEKLQEIAKLQSISHTVPVSFNLLYKK